jgi:hypothetical protein
MNEQPKHDQLRFPVHYENGRVAGVFYSVDAQIVSARVPSLGVHPLVIAGKAFVSLAWFDYERSDFGSYRELSLGILVDREQRLWRQAARLALGSATGKLLSLGSYVLALPVTSPTARDAGVTLAGLPKTLMELPLTWTGTHLDATALEGGERVLTMRIPLGRGPVCPVPALVIYSRLNERLLSTKITTRFRPQMDWVGRPWLTVENEAHPLGALTRDLGLERAPCLGIVHGVIRTAALHAPEPVT